MEKQGFKEESAEEIAHEVCHRRYAVSSPKMDATYYLRSIRYNSECLVENENRNIFRTYHAGRHVVACPQIGGNFTDLQNLIGLKDDEDMMKEIIGGNSCDDINELLFASSWVSASQTEFID